MRATTSSTTTPKPTTTALVGSESVEGSTKSRIVEESKEEDKHHYSAMGLRQVSINQEWSKINAVRNMKEITKSTSAVGAINEHQGLGEHEKQQELQE